MRAAVAGWPLALALVLSVSACHRERMAASPPVAEASGEVVAVVDGRAITASDLPRQGDLRRDRRALDLLIARKLASEEARRRRLEEIPDVTAAIETLRRETAAREEEILRDALLAALSEDVSVGEDELRAHYEKTRSRYMERRIRLCRQRFGSKEEADAFAAALGPLGPAGHLAPESCEAIGPVGIEGLPDDLVPEALRLQRPGDRTLVLRDGGASLVELVEILPAAQLSFEEARSQAEKSLRTLRAQEAFRVEIERLRGAARIEIDEAALRSLSDESRSAAIGPGSDAR